MEKNKNIPLSIETIELVLIFGLVSLLPLLVLPSFPNAFDTPKLVLLSFGIAILVFIKTLKTIATGKVGLSVGKFDLPVLLLACGYLVSSIVQSPNKMDAYLLPGTATVIIAGSLLYFLINQSKQKQLFEYALTLSALSMSVVILLAITGVLKAIPGISVFFQDASFTTLGGSLPTLIFLVVVLPIAIKQAVNQKQMVTKAFLGITSAFIVFGIFISGFNSLPGKATSPQLPNFETSWVVAIDTLKFSPLLGVGPGNYVAAFNRFRPLTYNQTDLWQLRFTSSRSYYITATTETGFVGVIALGLLVLMIVRHIQILRKISRERNLVGWGTSGTVKIFSLVLLMALFLFLPATPILLLLLFILLALASEVRSMQLNFQQSSSQSDLTSKIPAIIVTLPVFVVILAFFFFAGKIVVADLTYRQAIGAIAKNDGGGAYELLQKTINTNPYVDRYRVTYAQVNLALANNIAQKQDINDQDRNTIAQLVQQSIREGKAAVTLNPQKAGNWELLASIYRTIIPLAQGADVFAFQTYSQAIALDPINPNTRIALGGLLYQAKNYKDAIDVFKLAVLAKPDFANAHYNLAAAYREDGQIDKAINEMTVVVSLVQPDSNDYEIARTELENLQTKKKEAGGETKQGETLTPPRGETEPSLEPPIELPEESGPPEPKVTPTPLPEGGTPTPTIIP